MIIGHRQIVDFFEKAAAGDRLGHAYGFVGVSGLGKRFIAENIAAKLLKTELQKLAVHPDYILVERGEDEKTGKLKKNITIEQARDLRARLQTTSWSGGRRVVVIDGAEYFNEESGNALLKMIEEPPRGAIFFLIVRNENALLQTVRSRLQIFYFSCVAKTQIEKGLISMGVETEVAKVASRRSLGRPGLAVKLLRGESSDEYLERYETFTKIPGTAFYKKLELVEHYYGDKDDGERGREAWQSILDSWMTWSRDLLFKKYGLSGFASEPNISAAVNFTDFELVKIIDSFSSVKKILRESAHPRLAVEEALLKIR